jgi:hypothetical protein
MEGLPVRRNSGGVALLLLSFVSAAPAVRADVVKWTLNNVVLTNFVFGQVSVSGYFDAGAPVSDITVVEGMYTYTFTGLVNGPDYGNRKSQHPPTKCILAGSTCPGGTVPGSPFPVSLSINICPTGPPLGPRSVACGTGFEDDLEPFGFPTGTATAAILKTATPEPATWPLMLVGFAVMTARWKLLRRSHGL